MNNKHIKKIFLTLITIEILYWVFIILQRGLYIDSYFVNDSNDTGMDYFNMLKISANKNPYYKNANYPAMCFIILKILYHIIPIDSANKFDSFELRNYMPALLGYFLFCLLCIIIIWEFSKIIFNGNKLDNYLCAISVILSGPFLFSLERGNLIILSIAFLMVFFAFYDSDNWKLRLLSYFMLGFSASLKIYPAVFGLLLFKSKKKSKKEIFFAIIIGIVIFITPFLYFDNGKSLKYMLDGIKISSEKQSNIGMNLNFSFCNMQKIVSALFFNNLSYKPIDSIIIPTLISFCIFIFSKEKWKQAFAITLFCIWIPKFSYTYCLLLFILPFILFCKEIGNKKTLNIIYNIFFVIILSPSAFPIVKDIDIYNAKFPLTYSTTIINLSIVIFALILTIDTFVFIFKGRQTDKNFY